MGEGHRQKLWAGLVALLLCFSLRPAAAAQSSPPNLIISQLKVTSSSGQFAAIYNNTDQPIDLESAQLQYFNNFDLSKATSSKLIPMTGILAPRGYAIVSDGPLTMCYQAVVISASMSFSSTSGFLQVSHFVPSLGPKTSSALDDYIGWSKNKASGAQTLPSNTSAFLQRQSLTDVSTPGQGTWQTVQPDEDDPCSLSSFVIVPEEPEDSQLLPGTHPPATIVRLAASTAGGRASNAGLMAPVITELLPNPAEPLKDADDEFIEIYNPNDKIFDLSGYGVQTGQNSTRTNRFPDGTRLEPKAFGVFTSADFSFSLSNSGGHVRLVGGDGKLISQSDAYGSAKDGQSWALANGKWYWTSKPTPGTPNLVDQGGIAASAASSKNSAVRSAASINTASAAGPAASASQSDPLHPWTLAVVGAAVILYAAYEYRNDMANQLYRIRRYREARRTSGQSD